MRLEVWKRARAFLGEVHLGLSFPTEVKKVAKTMRRKYICTNGVVEVTQFTVGDKAALTEKRWRRAKTREDKRDENARQAVRVAARILNCNYTQEDYLVELTYSDESMEKALGVTYDQLQEGDGSPCTGEALDLDEIWGRAKGVLAKRMEQVQREAKKKNIEVKTFATTSDMDQETGELVRVHHHVVVNAAGLEILKKKWTCGLVLEKHLYRQDDYTPLAVYLLGQVRHKENRKKYSCSRNMVQPEVEEMVLAEDPCNEIRVQPGAKVLDRSPYRDGTVNQYVRYKRKPSTRKRGGRKLGSMSPQSPDGERDPCVGEPLAMRNDKNDGAKNGGGSEFRDKTAEGGSEYEFSEIERG